jgi:hypothetical protein
MAEQLSKLRPDRDLQCYFRQPSAIAALSETSTDGFTISGCWREQFDWAVLEWNRDNVFEHPLLRNLPDGDLSGVRLSYREIRSNCIPLDSTLWPTVDWPYLRVWADSNGAETLYQVPLSRYATPSAGEYSAPTVQFELQGTPTKDDYIELSWLDQHFNYRLNGSDTIAAALSWLASAITANQATGFVTASASGNQIVLTYLGMPGVNGNRVGVYGTVHGACTESWTQAWATFCGGTSPTCWQIDLDFGALQDIHSTSVPTTNVRKLRWTWAAGLQPDTFQRGEFSIAVSGWSVTGTKVGYMVAGPGTRRIEDDSTAIAYQGHWSDARGNFSGGSIHWTTTPGDSVHCSYTAPESHSLYLGARYADTGALISVQVDNAAPRQIQLQLAYYQDGTRILSGEDVLVRIPLGQLAGDVTHQITITHAGTAGAYFYFDFLELAVPANSVGVCDTVPGTSLATDWDTLHSIAVAPERTAWLIDTLGFHGRVNHYAGALWFYELCASRFSYPSMNITFSGASEFGKVTTVTIGGTDISHLNLIGDTSESVARCFALLINAGSTGVWASADGAVLTITARAIGSEANGTGVNVVTNSNTFHAQRSAPILSGGADGKWITDLAATPRINRACRDWSVSFFRALDTAGLAVTASFSMELGNGDDSTAAAIAQRYPNGDPAWLNTPALQTNFGPESTAYWKQVYIDMAGLMASAAVVPYLQFGEVQWWYFAAKSGMPFYDAYTTGTFQTQYGRPMAVIASENDSPQTYTAECAFLAKLIGEFTQTIMEAVRQAQPGTRFEVLYPPDVNNTALNRLVNYPAAYWTPAALDCLKTENFTYTGDRNLNLAQQSIQLPMTLGFPPAKSSHLVGIGDYTTPWMKERRMAVGAGVESVVLFALDQFCLIGYALPLDRSRRQARFLGR